MKLETAEVWGFGLGNGKFLIYQDARFILKQIKHFQIQIISETVTVKIIL